MLTQSFFLVLPILLITAAGFLLTRIYHLDQNTLIQVIFDFLMPMLIFKALYESRIEPGVIMDLAGVTSFVVFTLLVAAFLYAKIVGITAGEFVPSIIFMNSGLLGIPLMQLWGGLAAMNVIVIYDQIQTLYIFTLGILIIAGGFTAGGFVRMAKSPILWAIIAGFLFRFLKIPVWEPLLTTMDFGGRAAPPLAALALGVSLAETKAHFNWHLLSGLILRFAGGFLAGLAGCSIFGVSGMERTVVLVASSLPSAVLSSVLPLRYGVRADFGSTMVVVSSILGAFTVPLTFWLTGVL